MQIQGRLDWTASVLSLSECGVKCDTFYGGQIALLTATIGSLIWEPISQLLPPKRSVIPGLGDSVVSDRSCLIRKRFGSQFGTLGNRLLVKHPMRIG